MYWGAAGFADIGFVYYFGCYAGSGRWWYDGGGFIWYLRGADDGYGIDSGAGAWAGRAWFSGDWRSGRSSRIDLNRYR